MNTRWFIQPMIIMAFGTAAMYELNNSWGIMWLLASLIMMFTMLWDDDGEGMAVLATYILALIMGYSLVLSPSLLPVIVAAGLAGAWLARLTWRR